MRDGLARKTRLAVVVNDVVAVGDLGLGEQTVITAAASGSPPPRCFLFLPRLDFPHITCTGGRDCNAGEGGACSSRKMSEVHGRAEENLRGGGTEALSADGGVGGKSE